MSQDTNLANNDGDRIDPATEDLQRELLVEFTKNSNHATNDVKFQVLTLAAATEGTPEKAHSCKQVQFWTALSDCYVGDEDSQPVLLIASIWNKLPINAVTNLRFLSATGGAVYIMSSN